jgi:small subunit ribosomal protein S18
MRREKLERKSKKTPFKKTDGRGRDRERDKDKDLFPREARKKICRFCQDKTAGVIDYKDLSRLSRFITERGRILSRRISGTCARHQRKVAQALRRTRFLALLR